MNDNTFLHFESCGSRALHVHVRASLVILGNQSTFEVNSDPFTATTIPALRGAAPSSEFRDAASCKLFNVRHSRPRLHVTCTVISWNISGTGGSRQFTFSFMPQSQLQANFQDIR